VIDPPRFPDEHLAVARARELEIASTADTHSHADYISGSPELRARGATFLAPASARLEIPHQAVADGDEIRLGGGLALRAIATPGHTPDHLAYLLLEDGKPAALFSGGSLMVGTVGRTDLLGPEPRDDLTRKLFHSLRERIMVLPDDLPVYPTHGEGSFCSAPGATERTTTIGRERRTNPLVTIDDEDTFVRSVLVGFGSFPSYFARLPEVNRRGPRVYGTLPELPALDIAAFQAATDRDAVVVDTRPIEAFAEAHIPGALSIELRPVFASWLGWLVDAGTELVFVVDNDQDTRELVRQCLDVGYEQLTGFLAGGVHTWTDAGLRTASIRLVAPDAIAGAVIDVRQTSEFAAGHVPGAQSVELGAITDIALPTGPVAIMCGHGERAMTGASVLTARGVRELTVVVGGPDDWASATGRSLEAL
jgi:glyoxylase-like metal-dependent hydrolase (beta-lactamase superfamily II)/rhodanese-related sulfurtransferase